MRGKKFEFSLASVLKLRMHETECARQELAGIILERERQEGAVEQAERYLRDVVASRSTGSTGQRALSRHEAYRREALDRLEAAKQKLNHLVKLEKEARLELIQRKGAEEALKQLRSEEEETFWKDFRMEEAKFLDEQAISSFQRQRRAANT